MTDILSTLERASFVEFVRLFRPEEGRMGVTVTFIAVLELMREGLIDIVQAEPFAPLHVRAAAENRMLRLVANNDAPADEAEPVFEAEPTSESTGETQAGPPIESTSETLAGPPIGESPPDSDEGAQ